VNPEFQYELKHTAHEILAGVFLRSGVHMGICSSRLGRSEVSVKASVPWEFSSLGTGAPLERVFWKFVFSLLQTASVSMRFHWVS
jgi:hypothetical protein